MYKIGDKIVYPMHGAVEIVDEVKKEIVGEVKSYFVLKLPIGEMTILLPVDSMETIGIRDVISEKEVDELLDRMEMMECNETVNWNKRYRENMNKLKSGSIDDVANVVKTLMTRDLEKGLSTGERKMLASAKQILLSEILLAKNITIEQAEELINERIKPC